MMVMIDLLDITAASPAEAVTEVSELLQGLPIPEGRLSEPELESVARFVAARPDLFQDLVVDDHERRWWLVLHRRDNVEVLVQSWEREQSSDWHDHGGSSGAFVVIGGSLVEQSRAADGVSLVSRRLAAGQVAAFGPGHVHDVRYESGEPAVSIHTYSPPLSGLTFYERTPYGFAAREVVPERHDFVVRDTAR